MVSAISHQLPAQRRHERGAGTRSVVSIRAACRPAAWSSPGSDASRPTETAGRRSPRPSGPGRSGVGRISLFDPEGASGHDRRGAEGIRAVSVHRPQGRSARLPRRPDGHRRLDGGPRGRGPGPLPDVPGGAAQPRHRARHRRGAHRVLRADVPPLLHQPGPEGLGLLDSRPARSARSLPRSRCTSACEARRWSFRPGAPRPPTRIGYAFRSIRFGAADALLTGGVDATVVRGIMEGFVMMRIVSTALGARAAARASRPFSADRDGFVLGEGAWMFVLEDAERAQARGARSTRRSAATGRPATPTTACGSTRRGEEPARAMTLALEEAGLRPGGHRVRRVPRHLDRAERPRGDPRHEAGVRRRGARSSPAPPSSP